MANETSSNANTNPAQAEMDDILSSIRSGVAEEGSKVGTGSADLIEASDVENGGEEDVLELSETDMVAAGDASGEAEELIDLEAFGASGEAKTVAAEASGNVAEELLQEEAVAPAIADAADEFDRLLAEISQEQQQQVVSSKISKEDLMAEDAPLGTEEAGSAVAAEEIIEPEEAGDTAPVEEVEPSPALTETVTQAAAARFEVGAIQGPEGVQVVFPAEVLAMALRPMVQDWLVKNLPDVVEKLVKEEISKLSQG